jgi:hypothetical protein
VLEVGGGARSAETPNPIERRSVRLKWSSDPADREKELAGKARYVKPSRLMHKAFEVSTLEFNRRVTALDRIESSVFGASLGSVCRSPHPERKSTTAIVSLYLLFLDIRISISLLNDGQVPGSDPGPLFDRTPWNGAFRTSPLKFS